MAYARSFKNLRPQQVKYFPNISLNNYTLCVLLKLSRLTGMQELFLLVERLRQSSIVLACICLFVCLHMFIFKGASIVQPPKDCLLKVSRKRFVRRSESPHTCIQLNSDVFPATLLPIHHKTLRHNSEGQSMDVTLLLYLFGTGTVITGVCQALFVNTISTVSKNINNNRTVNYYFIRLWCYNTAFSTL